jgi:hypothetical protein
VSISAGQIGPSVTIKGGGPPLAAVNPTCSVCGQAVWCGGPNCPNNPVSGSAALLPVGYDAVKQVATIFLSVPVKAVNGPSAGFYVVAPGA